MPPGSPRPRVQHAHPVSLDARASLVAVAFRDAERRERRLGRSRRSRRRFALPGTALFAAVAVLIVVAQPFSAKPIAASSTGDRSGMDLSQRFPRATGGPVAAEPTARPTDEPPLVAGIIGKAVLDDAVQRNSGYVWPLEHARITQDFGPSASGLFVVDGQRFHDGIDIANFCGAPILAAHDGTVVAASRHVVSQLGWTGDVAAYDAYLAAKHLWGSQARIIVIDDGNGFRSVYVHLHRIDVKAGDHVKAGQQIGLEGSSGHATGCHLHYSLYAPAEVARWATYPKDVERYHLPTGEVARIDPLTLLPPLATGWITWGWGAQGTD
ncbi:MAG TPA: M23 family metallopeptidase [Candidatus Limnocylindrales bacterium]